MAGQPQDEWIDRLAWMLWIIGLVLGVFTYFSWVITFAAAAFFVAGAILMLAGRRGRLRARQDKL